VAGHVASLECQFEKRLSPLLPTSHIRIGRKAVFEENKLAARLQDSANPANSFFDPGNSAHRERANNVLDSYLKEAILDLHVPGLNGLEGARVILRENPEQ
jgi:hypothetical protein